jgi:hypothetical protein
VTSILKRLDATSGQPEIRLRLRVQETMRYSDNAAVLVFRASLLPVVAFGTVLRVHSRARCHFGRELSGPFNPEQRVSVHHHVRAPRESAA